MEHPDLVVRYNAARRDDTPLQKIKQMLCRDEPEAYAAEYGIKQVSGEELREFVMDTVLEDYLPFRPTDFREMMEAEGDVFNPDVPTPDNYSHFDEALGLSEDDANHFLDLYQEYYYDVVTELVAEVVAAVQADRLSGSRIVVVSVQEGGFALEDVVVANPMTYRFNAPERPFF